MKYYQINRSCEPSIIGVNDASSQVGILNTKTKHSFVNEYEKQYFNDFVNKNRKDISRAAMDSFVTIDASKIPFIKCFKTKKKVKEVDIMYYMPREVGFDIVISKKFLDLLEKYKLPDYNKINIRVEDFDTEYYLIGFPLINASEIDFKKSIFRASFKEEKYVFNNFEEWKNHFGLKEPESIILKNKFEYDVLKINFGIFFSQKMVNEIEKMNLKALEVDKDTILECL